MQDVSRFHLTEDKFYHHSIRGYYYDFIPLIIPGNIFLVFGLAGFVFPIMSELSGLKEFVPSSMFHFDNDVKMELSTIILLTIPFIGFWLILTYIIGFMFYRQEPRAVDEVSYRYMGEKLKGKGAVRPHRTNDGDLEDLKSIKVEFPYRDLKEFFSDRGLSYLSQRIPWDYDHQSMRSKHFANALKIRIKLEDPSAYDIIAKNESDVRTASSLWFALRLVLILTLIGMFVSFWPIVIYLLPLTISPGAVKFVPNIYLIFGQFIIIIGSMAALHAIMANFHYQRQREISFIMETAHWLLITNRIPNMFFGLQATESNPAPPPA